MDTFTLIPGRSWIIRAIGRNPLVRFNDRLEAILLMLVFATALFVTPVAGAIGTAVYEMRARLYVEEAQTRHAVTATATEDSTVIVEQAVEGFSVQSRWLGNGVEHIGSIDVASSAKVGDPVNIWWTASGIRSRRRSHLTCRH